MNVDADSLEQLNLRTRDGAERAGRAFGDAVDAETRIGATKITLANHRDLVAELLADSEACLAFSLDGPLSGTALLSFDDTARARIQAAVESTDATPNGSVADLGVSLIGAFIEEWEAHVDAELTVDAPTYVDDPSNHTFEFEAVHTDTESAPVFQSVIEGTDGEGRVTLSLVPDADSLATLLAAEGGDDGGEDFGMGGADSGDAAASFGMAGDDNDDAAASFATDDGGDSAFEEATDGGAVAESGGSLFEDDGPTPLPLEKLSVFSDLTREGTRSAAERVTQMTGVQTETDIAGINFTPIDDISGQLEDDRYVGTTTEFEGTPSGHLVILFEADAAQRIAETMLPMDPDGEGLTPMHESALEELGNIMTSGFIDGWANVLQTSVDHTPPEFTDDMDMAMLEIVTDQLGPFQTHAYTIESRIVTDDIEFDCEIHALPNESKLSAALDSLLVERRDQTHADPDDVF